jgi:hypothetical protein
MAASTALLVSACWRFRFSTTCSTARVQTLLTCRESGNAKGAEDKIGATIVES